MVQAGLQLSVLLEVVTLLPQPHVGVLAVWRQALFKNSSGRLVARRVNIEMGVRG